MQSQEMKEGGTNQNNFLNCTSLVRICSLIFAFSFIISTCGAEILRLVDGESIDCKSISFDAKGALIERKGSTVTEKIFWSLIAPAQLDASAKKQQEAFIQSYLNEASSTTNEARANSIRKGLAPLLKLLADGELESAKESKKEARGKTDDLTINQEESRFDNFFMNYLEKKLEADPEISITFAFCFAAYIGILLLFGLVFFWKIIRGDGEEMFEDTPKVWPFLFFFVGGGLIGIICGGCAHTFSKHIFRSFGINPVTFILSIGSGIASIFAYAAILFFLLSFVEGTPAGSS